MPFLLTGCFVPYIFGDSSSEKPSDTFEPTSYSYDEDADYNILPSLYTYKDYTDQNYYDLGAAPSVGEARLLVIPVWFTDSSDYITSKSNVRKDIIAAYFGSTSDTGWQSVKSFYEAESRGRLIISGIVTDWYSCGKSSTSFYSEESGATQTASLVNSAVSWYKKTYSVSNLSDFDRDKDGYIDGVMLIYGSPDYSAMKNSKASNMWAYCYWLQNTSAKSKSNPGANQFFWASYDFMYGTNKASMRTGKSSYASGDTNHCSIDAHTYIHEMGHVFGLEDYYDYHTTKYNPAAGFSMQDSNVGAHDPFSKFSLGWGDAIVPQKTSTFTLKPIESSGQFVILTPNTDKSSISAFDEYIIIELYTPTGLNQFDSNYKYMSNYPQGPKVSGVRVWHVDARLYGISKSSSSGFSGRLTTNPYDSSAVLGVTHATSNSGGGDYGAMYAGSYSYNILQLIRNSTSASYTSKDDLKSSDLFKSGDTFSLSKYKSQFVNSAKLNSNKDLGWEVTFGTLSSEGISITVTKA